MKMNSITFKLLSIIFIAFVLSRLVTFTLVERQITNIIDKSQEEIYFEKTDIIISILARANQGLLKTKMVEAYRADFQEKVIADINTYIQRRDSPRYPFIINGQGEFILSAKSLSHSYRDEIISAIAEIKKTTVTTKHLSYTINNNWYVFNIYKDWDWTVGYVVPMSEKHKDAIYIRYMGTTIIAISSIIVLALLTFLLTKFVKPIVELNKIAIQMADGDLDQDITSTRIDEVGTLTRSFSRMRDAVKLQIRNLNAEVAERRFAEEDLRITLNSIGDGVIATDNQGLVSRMNPIAEKLTGWQMPEATGKPLLEIFNIINGQNRKLCENPVEKVLQSGEIVGLANHTILIAKDGTEYQIADSGAPIHNADGEIVGVVLVFRDVTGQYKLQKQLRQSERMQAIGQLAGGVAHDFNNQLVGVLGYADMLVRQLEDEELIRYAENICTAATRSADLTKKLLAFSRQGQFQFEPVDVHEIIHETVEMLRHSIDKRIKIIQQLDAHPSKTSGDPSQLQNALLNLALNARDAMPDGGELTFKTELIHLDSSTTEMWAEPISSGEYIQVSITDTGSGIAPEVQPHIFEPFFTTKEQGQGTGMGLAAVYGTVKQSMGAISVYSEIDDGTVFKICLPVNTNEEMHKPATDAHDVPVHSWRILVVDDEELVRDLACDMLGKVGHKTLTASDGQSAIDLYREKWQEIDLVILDMVMPNIDGKEAFRAMKRINPEIKAILSSGYSINERSQKILAEGVQAFAEKPYRVSQLNKVIHSVMSNGL